MRSTILCCTVLLLSGVVIGQRPEEGNIPKPALIPPEAWETTPQATSKKQLDTEQLKGQANELAKLATAVPADIERVRNGMLPKDLRDRLRRIENLSKQLRRELYP